MNANRSIIIILYSLKFIFGFWRDGVMKSKKTIYISNKLCFVL